MSNISEKKISSRNSSYRKEIDGLRAFAVVCVIINHFNKNILPSGYLGVDIFFVISGFVITSSLHQRPSKNFKDFISGFYERRIKRLVPALSVFVLITSIAICLFNSSPGISLRTGLTSLIGLSNIYLFQQSTDYFAQSTELNVFTHTWSLGVEEQFYILFPILVWFSGFGRQTKNGARNLFLIVGTLSITSLIGFLYLYSINQSAAYFLLPTRFWEISSGCLLFIGFQKRKSIEHFFENIPPILVLASIIGIMYLPISWAKVSTVSVVALSAVLLASLKKGGTAFTFFTNPKVVYLGLISYSLYLWHWGILSISRWTIGIHWWSVPFQIALMFVLAAASFRYIETPLRKGNWFGKRWKTILCGGGVIFTLSGVLIALGRPLKGKLFAGNSSTSIVHNTNWRDEIRLGNSSLTGKICHADKTYSSEELRLLFNICKYPFVRQSNSQPTIAFVGDSHAETLLNAEEIITKAGFRVIHYSHAGCPFPIPPHGLNPPECNDFLISAEKEIFQDLKPGDSIVIYNYHLNHLGSQSLKDTRHNIFNHKNYIVKDSPRKINLYMSGLNRLSKKAYENSIKIYLIGSAYRNNDIEFTKEWFRPNDRSLKTLFKETDNANKINQTLSKKIKESSLSNITFLNPLKIIDQNCGMDIKSYLVCFRDSDHLSDKSAKVLINFLLINYLRP